MVDLFKALYKHAGSFEGTGINHEGQGFRGILSIIPQFEGKGLTIDFCATGVDGTVYHKEHSILGITPFETLSLWVLSNNHPGVVEHKFFDDGTSPGAKATLSFRCGDFDNTDSFREVISIDLWPTGDVSYRYSWGMPGGHFKERSAVKMFAGRNRSISEAKLKSAAHGLIPEGEGWYVLNAKDAAWQNNEKFGDFCTFEGDRRFEQYGINIHVIHPGQPNCHYHGEDDQENFLVIKGQCKLLIEGQERLLREWDFVHCPKWTRHVFIGTGNEPCSIVMVGGRTGHGVIYPAIDLAKTYGACPERETDSPKESYASSPKGVDCKSKWPN